MSKRREPSPPPLRRFDFNLVKERVQGAGMNIDRDLARRLKLMESVGDVDGATRIVSVHTAVRFAINAYNAAIYLIRDEPPETARKATFTLVLPPINRQLLDLLFSLIYIFDDYMPRMRDFQRSGWREAKEHYDKHRERFHSDPEWKNFFRQTRRFLNGLAKEWQISSAEEKKPQLIRRWYTPSSLKDERTSSRPFMRYLYKWVYEDISEQAHMSGSGLHISTTYLFGDMLSEDKKQLLEERHIKQYHFIHVSRILLTLLAILTEVNFHFGLGNGSQL
jgi:hypothetical protein